MDLPGTPSQHNDPFAPGPKVPVHIKAGEVGNGMGKGWEEVQHIWRKPEAVSMPGKGKDADIREGEGKIPSCSIPASTPPTITGLGSRHESAGLHQAETLPKGKH